MARKKLPQAILNQVEAADKLMQSMQAAAGTDVPAPEQGVPAVEPPAEPNNAPVDGQGVPVVEPPAGDVQPEQVVRDNVPVVQPQGEDFRHKYSVLQGKYNAEVPRLNAQLRDAQAKMQAMAQELLALKAAQAEKPVPPAQKPEDNAGEFDDDLDMRSPRERAEMARMAAEIQELRKQLAENGNYMGSVEETVRHQRDAQFLTELGALVPDYATINENQQFLDWLQGVDPMYGISRQDALNSAANAYDSVRVAHIFNAWKSSVTDMQQTRRDALARQVTPDTARGGSAAPTPSPEIVTWADYQYAYSPKALRNLGAEKVKELRARVDEAYVQGRIR